MDSSPRTAAVCGWLWTTIAGGTVVLVDVSMTVTPGGAPLDSGTYRNGPCCAWAPSVATAASAPSHTPPSSAALVIAGRVLAASRTDLPHANASPAHRRRAPRAVPRPACDLVA